MERIGIDEAALGVRVREVELELLDERGEPLPDRELTVHQNRHAFAFGNIGFDFLPLASGQGAEGDAQLAELWLDLFNTATLPFYWAQFEPERGDPATTRLRSAAQWFADRGVALKGHPLAWHTLAPEWLRGLPLDEVEALLRGRIRREVEGFAGLIDTWDGINEVVIMPVFDKDDNAITRLAEARGRVPMIRLAFEEARAANPAATLVLNDFDLSPAYEHLIEDVLEAGVRVDAIGLQTHMHQGYRGEEEVLGIVERFARFGLPLHFTETSLVSGDVMPADIVDLNDHVVDSWPSTPAGEDRQADELARHYRSLLSHPAVEAITYWGITDRDAWLGAPIGLVRADGSPKPSYSALHALIKGSWWLSPTGARTDAAGRIRVAGFAGEFAVSAADLGGSFQIGAAADAEADGPLRVRLGRAS
jgi:endo-1,4-beta-xylanase